MPTAREKLLGMYRMTPEEFGPVLTGDPGNAPSRLAGLVMNPRNAQKISQMLSKIPTNNSVQKALQYMFIKYPKLSRIPSRIIETAFGEMPLTRDSDMFIRYPTVDGKVIDLVKGSYQPLDKTVNMLTTNLNTTARTSRAVETAGHELTHAFRDRRGLIDKLLEYNVPIDMEEYLARRGGATARKTYEKFLELMGK